MGAKARKTWREKLSDSKGLPRVGVATGKMAKRWGTGTFVIPSPREVDEVIRKIPKGKLATIAELRQSLARKHKVSFACPVTTGIFAWIAAHAAEEDRAAGAKQITPYWRALKAGGEINPKYPGGPEALRILLESEGHRVIQKGKRYMVENFTESVYALK